MKTILLLGRTGLLGSCFYQKLEAHPDFKLVAPSHAELELLEFERVRDSIKDLQPDLIVHCVAYSDVEKAEQEPEVCNQINAIVLQNILKTEIPIIHFSTDYVFDVENIAIDETTPQTPLNVYGASKKRAEEFLQEYGKSWWNIRTSWLFGSSKNHFITKILDKAKIHPKLEVVDDQIGRPTYAEDLAQHVITHFLEQASPPGHYHLQNSGTPVSWAGLADFVIKHQKLETQIVPVATGHYPTKAQRPKNSLLQNTKLPDMRDWKTAVADYLEASSNNQ